MRILLRLCLLVAALAALNVGARWMLDGMEPRLVEAYQSYGAVALYGIVAVYAVAMSLPYVPGIEISLALLMILGTEAVAVVYGATLVALCASFLVGRLIPSEHIARLFGWLHLERARELMTRMGPLTADERLSLLADAAPQRFVPFLLRHRYLALALAFNLPGNSLIGGGGGIALAAGMSGLFRFPVYALTVSLAISPIPLMMLMRG